MAREERVVVAGELTSFVGRQDEVAEVRRLLGEARLVTLTGPGGVGKTRLALQVMHRSARAFADGTVFAELAELRDGDLLPNHIAERIGLHDQSGRGALDAVLEFLRDRRLLLVLDNCEHLVDACASLVDAVTAGCPGIAVLATSRQSLGVAVERLLPVPPLEVSTEAVSLFVDRAVAVMPTFERTAGNEPDLVRIADRLDGLPLAIELAATWIRSLSPAQIADRLTGRLELLTSGKRDAPHRHQTLRAAIEWSHELCTPDEQAVWSRASVFAGSFDIDAANHVCADPELGGDVLKSVDALVDKSVLLREETAGNARYRMLETLREYGQERLDGTGDLERVTRLHRDWFDRLTERADAEWSGPRQVEWVARLRADHANIRTALGWSLARPGEAEVALRMMCGLDEYWGQNRGFSAEAQLWLDRALAATPVDHPDRALALTISALYSLWQTKLDDTDQRLAAAAELAAGQGDDVLDARITYVRSLGWMMRGKLGTAALAASAASTFRAHGLVRRELHPLFILGVASAYEGDVDAGRQALRRMLDLAVTAGDVYFEVMAYFGTVLVEVDFGDVDAAAEAGLQSLRRNQRIDARLVTAFLIDSLAWVADAQGDHPRAATLFGAAAAIWDSAGAKPDIAVSIPHRRHRKSSRAALGDTRFDTAHAAGRALPTDEAIRYALGETDTDAIALDPACYPPLSKRESEIADLVASGLTNRQIAHHLVIAPRTADTHVQHILSKLEFSSRAQIASWVVNRRK